MTEKVRRICGSTRILRTFLLANAVVCPLFLCLLYHKKAIILDPEINKGGFPMNETMQALLTRRSVRKYTPQMPKREDLEQIIEAGLYAASGKGGQSSIILAVTDKALRDRLMEMNRKIGGWEEGFDPFYGAPAVLVVLAKKGTPYTVADGSLSLGNMMLAAHALGLGSCWINRAREAFDTEEGREILRSLGVEGEYEGVGHCIVGYPDGDLPQPKERKAGRVFWAE